MTARTCGTLIAVCLLAASGHGQVARVSKSEARWGESVTVTYDPSHPGAGLDASRPIHVVLFVHGESGSRQEWLPTKPGEDGWVAEIPIAEGTAYLQVYFVTRHSFDREARLSLFVRQPDGAPARGAHLQRMFEAGPGDYLVEFEKELAAHPDHWAAYRTKWFTASAFDREGVEAMIRADLEALEDEAPDQGVGWLYSRCYANGALGEEAAARADLEELSTRYPTHPLTLRAFSSWDYQAFSKSFPAEAQAAVDGMRRKIVREHPECELARESVRLLAAQEDFSWEDVERICRPWIADDPAHPQPYLSLARSLELHGVQLERAAELAERGIDGLLEGDLRLRDDVSGTRTQMTLPSAYAILSRAALKNGDHAQALAAAIARRELAYQDVPDDDEMLADVWAAIGDDDRTQAAWARADAAGSARAVDELRAMYQQHHGSEAGFVEHLAQLRAKLGGKEESLPAAADFDVRSLDGEPLRLADLRGKVVVLNFWFIGCAPCRVEIPGLNELVERYADREDVVFIGFASDPSDELKEFLAKTPFSYQIVAKASEIAHRYGVEAWPTHVIIDPNGNIAARLTGGNEDRHEDLIPHIERLL